jgi:hypothetical protein
MCNRTKPAPGLIQALGWRKPEEAMEEEIANFRKCAAPET